MKSFYYRLLQIIVIILSLFLVVYSNVLRTTVNQATIDLWQSLQENKQ